MNAFDSTWNLWDVICHLDTVREQQVASGHRSLLLPSQRDLTLAGVDLFVLDRELRQGMCPSIFTRALRLGVINIDAFNNSPHRRENAAEYYDAMAAVVDRVEEKDLLRRGA